FESLLGRVAAGSLVPPATRGIVPFFEKPVSARDLVAGPLARIIKRSKHPNISQACALLAIEWLLCARQLDERGTADDTRFGDWVRGFGAATQPDPCINARDAGIEIVLDADDGAALVALP